MIATIWETGHYPTTWENNGYYIEAGSLGFSVIVFTVLAIICIIFIVARRYIVGGELGGKKFGRTWSCVFLCSLWIIYITLSSLQAYSDKTGFDMSDMGGFDLTKVHRLEKCWSDKQIKTLKEWNKPVKNKEGKEIKYPRTDENGNTVTLYDDRKGIAKCIKGILK
jgi:hypothetical protein